MSGTSVLATVYAISGISGCHINPAVSISMLATGKMKLKDAMIYVIMQCLGAIIGAALLYQIAIGSPFYSFAYNGLGQNGYENALPTHFSMTSAFIAEVT